MRRRVSGATPSLSQDLLAVSKAVIVRHVPLDLSFHTVDLILMHSAVPLTLMLSPRCASARMSEQLARVSDVPPPPLEEVSSC